MLIRGTLLPLAATPPYEPNAITKGVIENNVNTKEFFAYLCTSLKVLAGHGRSCSQESHSTKTQISPRGGGSLLIKRSEAGGIQRGKDPVYLFVCLFVCLFSLLLYRIPSHDLQSSSTSYLDLPPPGGSSSLRVIPSWHGSHRVHQGSLGKCRDHWPLALISPGLIRISPLCIPSSSQPYNYKDLEPHIDEETMRIHYEKHHEAYTANLNKAFQELSSSGRFSQNDGGNLLSPSGSSSSVQWMLCPMEGRGVSL